MLTKFKRESMKLILQRREDKLSNFLKEEMEVNHVTKTSTSHITENVHQGVGACMKLGAKMYK